jgi:hypothetical protein
VPDVRPHAKTSAYRNLERAQRVQIRLAIMQRGGDDMNDGPRQRIVRHLELVNGDGGIFQEKKKTVMDVIRM